MGARKVKGVGQGKAGQSLHGSGEGLGLQFPLGIRTPQAGSHTEAAVEPQLCCPDRPPQPMSWGTSPACPALLWQGHPACQVTNVGY